MLEKWIVKAVPVGETDWAIFGAEDSKAAALTLARSLDRKFSGLREIRIFRWCLILGVGWRYVTSDTIYFQNRTAKKKTALKKDEAVGGPVPNCCLQEDPAMAVSLC